MAALDTLLKALVKNKMDRLVLEPDRLPRLVQGDTQHEVTRSALPAGTLARLVGEVTPEGQPLPAAAGADERRFTYTLDGLEFTFRATPGPAGWQVEARQTGSAADGDATPAATAAPPPRVEATAEPVTGDDDEPAEPAMAVPGGSAAAGGGSPPAAQPGSPPRVSGDGGIGSIRTLLAAMVERNASDLHVSAEQEVRMRIDGELLAVDDWQAPGAQELQQLLFEIAPQEQQEEYLATHDVDFGYELPGKARFRVNYYADRRGIAAAFRQIPTEIPTAEQLGLPESLESINKLSKGLVLVTGPTGSGKSTTLAAMLDRINRTRPDHIITIEDPIEFVHPSRRCLVHQRQVGMHTESFAKALRAALREDPDVVLVGEMRDLETTAIALETAETGHLVFGTLHTTSAVATVDRLVDQYPPDQQEQVRMMLAESLKAVISQNLLRRKEGGRVAAFEVLLITPAISNMIREGKTFQMTSAMQTGRRMGMCLLNDSLLKLVQDDVVEVEEAYLKAADKDDLLNRLRSANIDTRDLQPTKAPPPGAGEG